MGNTLDKMCPCFRKKKNYNLDSTLSQDLLEEYRSNNNSMEIDKIKTLQELRIKPSTFIRESNKLPNEVYEKIGYIGEGAYGTVIKVKPIYLNEERAMKVINKSHLFFNVSESDVYNEIKILKSLDHPNIIKIYEFFSDSINYYMVNEYCEEGDLYNKIEKISYLNEKVVKNVMKQIFSAVAYLHSKGIIHGDLKLENILIDSSAYSNINESFKKYYSTSSSTDKKEKNHSEFFDIKLIDFGCSKFFTKETKYSGVVGSSFYCAPEVVNNQYDEKSDLWSCGVIMYVLLSGKAPFCGFDEVDLTENIQKGEFNFDYEEFSNVSKSAKELINFLLNKNPKKRISARQALKHSWFTSDSCFDEVNIIDLNYSKVVLNNLKNFHAEQKFQQAVVTYITHNLVKKNQMQHLRKVFNMFDKDHDGRISKMELKQAFSDLLGTVLADIELEAIFRSIDHDNNGYIEYEEFLRATIDKDLLLSEPNLQMAFNLFDIDKNGFISVDEIRATIGGGKNIPDNVMSQLLGEIDKKQDEEVNYVEFKEIMNKIVK
jgi:calcium-dependent protein kinase